FALFGYWLAHQPLRRRGWLRKALLISLLLLIGTNGLRYLAEMLLPTLPPEAQELGLAFLSTSPMPPLPLYLLSGMAWSLVVICACQLWYQAHPSEWLVQALQKTGRLALTCYVAHVVIGMGLPELVFSPVGLAQAGITFSFFYGLVFSASCLVFARWWLHHFRRGPLEAGMRWLERIRPK
ncbi:MAG: DUF418 domain-containing protein, partial [Bacteroidota bacterium]